MATALKRWGPDTNLAPRNAIDQLFEESFVRPWSLFWGDDRSTTRYLPLDIYETDEFFVVKAFVPGVSADNLDITMQQNTLSIKAEQPVEHQEGARYYLRERVGGTWYRSFELPAAIDADHIEANLEDGVLWLKLPKAPEAKPRRVQIAAS